MTTANSSFHSEFGGLWTDRLDAKSEIKRRARAGEITLDDEVLLEQWVENGFVILPGAVEPELCALLASELEAIFREGSDTVFYQEPEAPPGQSSPVPRGLPPSRMRLVDLYGASLSAAKILLSQRIAQFLKLVFGEAPLCFQGLTFEMGSEQGLHQDTAYVVVDRPLELAAAWVALEDVAEGSGELAYLVGSHRLPDWKFGGNSKHWDSAQHGTEDHDNWSKWLVRKSEELGFGKKLFRPVMGDVLIWSADLVHGGSPVGDRTLTRRSLVGHYCPASRTPHYFNYLQDREKVPFQSGFYSSAYYSTAALRASLTS